MSTAAADFIAAAASEQGFEMQPWQVDLAARIYAGFEISDDDEPVDDWDAVLARADDVLERARRLRFRLDDIAAERAPAFFPTLERDLSRAYVARARRWHVRLAHWWRRCAR